jgi:hypothetical protein
MRAFHQDGMLTPEAVLELQRTVGNGVLTDLISAQRLARRSSPSTARLNVQRHDSFEHRLLGDAPPNDLAAMSTNADDPSIRLHLLKRERERLRIWQVKPAEVTEAEVKSNWKEWKDLKVLTLKKSGLVLTYGDLNALPDYMANPEAIDRAEQHVVLPILQTIRQEGFNRLSDLIDNVKETYQGEFFLGPTPRRHPHERFTGAVGPAGETGTLADIQEVKALDKVTGDLGTNKYEALLSRNACHFTPYNWHRWEEFHAIGRQKAQAAHKEKDPKQKAELAREAWLNNGYADHFLQDAFAAGHLINKTEIMQWFVRWVEIYGKALGINLDNWQQIRTMTEAQQPGISAPHLYGKGSRQAGQSADPQTAEEQATPEGRVQVSGVQATKTLSQKDAYRNYLAFLNSTVVQQASKNLHSYFNEVGLVASSPADGPYPIYGDASMLESSRGTLFAAQTAHMSQQAIQNLLAGKKAPAVGEIRSHFPNMAGTKDGDLHDLTSGGWKRFLIRLCYQKIFPDVNYHVLDTVSPKLGTVSKDQAAPAPGTFEAGDTVIRQWVSDQDLQSIGRQPTQEKVRMINRLLNGWVSDDDVAAIERICRSVTYEDEMEEIRGAIEPRVTELSNFGDRARVRAALLRRATIREKARR